MKLFISSLTILYLVFSSVADEQLIPY